MQIRKLEQKDKTQMLALMEEFWMKHHRGELLTGEIKEISELKNPLHQMEIELNQYFNWITFVAEENNELLGFVSARITTEEDLVLDKVGYIEELFVTKKARGQKLGQVLFEKVISELESNGCKVLRTSAFINNTPALSLYRKYGFIDEAIELVKKVK